MRLVAYGGASTLSATCAVLAAFRQRANFYAASVYLSKSNACMMILCNFGIFCTIILAKVLQTIFFGQLRLAEIERVNDRLWFTISETLLALAMFRDEFDTSFVVLFISLIFVKCFHWLAAYRVEWMDQTTSPPGRLFHARMVSVLSVIWMTDMLLIAYATESVLLHGPSVVLMFEMEYIIMQVTCLSIIAKYILNSYAHYRAQEHWEGKSTYQFYIDLATDLLKLLTYIGFLSLTLTFHGLPINVLRDVYYTFRSFVTKCNNLVRFRQATRNMNQRYPNATRAEMDSLSDKTCIICREDMEFRDENEPQPADPVQNNNNNNGTGQAGPNDTPKKLICGHIFHFHCLRSWLERQQTCPTCRRPVIQAPAATQPAPQNPVAGHRAFAAAMAAAVAGLPANPAGNPPAPRAGAPAAAPLGPPAAQAPAQPAQGVAADGTLIGNRPDGTRQDFHHRMREFEQRFAAATAARIAGPTTGPASQIRQTQSRTNNPLLQFDLSPTPAPPPSASSSGSRARPITQAARLRLNPLARPNSSTPTLPYSQAQASVFRKNSQSTTELPQNSQSSSTEPQNPPTSVEPPNSQTSTESQSPPKSTESQSAQKSTESQSASKATEPLTASQSTTCPLLPRLIPLFDHQQNLQTLLLPTSTSTTGSLTHQTLLQEYQKKIVEFGDRGSSSVDSIHDPKTAQLLEIQNCLVDCCSKLARFMATNDPPPIPSNQSPTPPLESLDPTGTVASSELPSSTTSNEPSKLDPPNLDQNLQPDRDLQPDDLTEETEKGKAKE
ncbi:hypothetical protein Pst134EB_019878 [Puccinia striiformis f. sp. tritici]|nr:hypothetical protein Pst134EB_019878 [Puccinia striiformis f. sp. tritici]